MNKSDKFEFCRIMVKLSMDFKTPYNLESQKESKEFFSRYWDALQGFSLKTLLKTFRDIADNRESPFFPKPGEIKAIASKHIDRYYYKALPAPERTEDESLLDKLTGKFCVYLVKVGRGLEYTKKERNEYVIRHGLITKTNLDNLIRRVEHKRRTSSEK